VPSAKTVSPDLVDWAEHWRSLVRDRRDFLTPPSRALLAGDPWDERTASYVRLSDTLAPESDPVVSAVARYVGPDGTLLDVGAGAGRYTFPLAAAATQVTAVEPSPGMCAALRAGLQRRGITNVRIVNSTWENANAAPHDVVLAAHVLYTIEAIVPFIEKLARAARRACFVVNRVEGLDNVLEPLWLEVRGAACPREPGFLDLHNLLRSMGIQANAWVQQIGAPSSFATLQDAVGFTRSRLGLSGDRSRDAVIRTFLLDTLVSADGGRLIWPKSPDTAIVWWET
jgi:SAM-dependent methyltransferase